MCCIVPARPIRQPPRNWYVALRQAGWSSRPKSSAEATYPPKDTVYALSVPGLDLVCGLDYLRCGGSSLPEHVLREGAGRRIVVHRRHSGVDGCEFALWSEGVLVRAIGINRVNGVVEDIGDPLPFEAPFWSGRHPHEPEKFIVGAGPSPFPTPFHPLDFGNAAVRALFGFIVEGRRSPYDVDPWTVRLHGSHFTPGAGGLPGRRRPPIRTRTCWL